MQTLEEAAAGFSSIAQQASQLPIARLTDRPAPEKWSPAECLAHLRIATEAYLPIWREALARARAEGLTGRPPYRLDLWGRFWVWFLDPPPKIRFPAASRFVPSNIGGGKDVLEGFLQSQEQVLATIKQAEGLAVDRIKISSAFDHRVRYSVWSSFCANLAHQRRHLRQARRAAEQGE